MYFAVCTQPYHQFKLSLCTIKPQHEVSNVDVIREVRHNKLIVPTTCLGKSKANYSMILPW